MIRHNSTIFLSILALAAFPGISWNSSAGYADSGTEQIRSDRHGVDARIPLVRLPESDMPFGQALIAISSTVGGELTGVAVVPAAVEEEIGRLADRVRPALRGRNDPREVISTLNRFLFVEEGFVYDGVAGNPDNYLLDRVIARRRGNCLGLTALYLLLAEDLSIPMFGVYLPSHCFVRYEDAGVRINIETGEKGGEWADERYLREFRLAGRGSYLRSLSGKEMVAVYLKSLGATFSRKKRDDAALRLYREAALLYPTLPDLYFNVGVSFHTKGMRKEAIEQYRRALALDPDLDVARDNLGAVLVKEGRPEEALAEARKAMGRNPGNLFSRGNLAAALCALGLTEDGIREYREVLEIESDNPRALAGLAKAHYARREFHEAIAACDRALALGCKFDPAMLGVLEQYREPSPDVVP